MADGLGVAGGRTAEGVGLEPMGCRPPGYGLRFGLGIGLAHGLLILFGRFCGFGLGLGWGRQWLRYGFPLFMYMLLDIMLLYIMLLLFFPLLFIIEFLYQNHPLPHRRLSLRSP